MSPSSSCAEALSPSVMALEVEPLGGCKAQMMSHRASVMGSGSSEEESQSLTLPCQNSQETANQDVIVNCACHLDFHKNCLVKYWMCWRTTDIEASKLRMEDSPQLWVEPTNYRLVSWSNKMRKKEGASLFQKSSQSLLLLSDTDLQFLQPSNTGLLWSLYSKVQSFDLRLLLNPLALQDVGSHFGLFCSDP